MLPFSKPPPSPNSLPAFCRAALTPSAPLALMPPPPSGANQPVSVSRLQMQLHLQGLQQNTNALRKQLSQLRNMQVGARLPARGLESVFFKQTLRRREGSNVTSHVIT